MLDLLIGSSNQAFSLGEVQYLSWQFLQGPTKDPQTYCSCGETFEKCSFWAPIFKEIENEYNVDLFNEPWKYDFSMNRNIHRFKKNWWKQIHNSVLSVATRHPQLRPFSELTHLVLQRQTKRNWDLFDKVANRAGTKFVVDSSKNLNRFQLLRKYRPNDVKLVVLSRDIRGVCSSSHEGLSEDIIFNRAKGWIKYHHRTVLNVVEQLSPTDVAFVSYDELCADTEKVLRTLDSQFGLGFSKDHDVSRFTPSAHHTIQGNPMRLKKGDLKVRYDQRWKQRLTNDQQKKLYEMMQQVDSRFQHNFEKVDS